MFASAATPIGTTGASEPPVSTTSHSPVAISRRASWNAMTDVAQAATWVMTGPVRPYSIDSRQPRHRARQGRDRERGDEARALLVVGVGAVDDLLDPAAARVHDDADPVPLVLVHRREVDARRLTASVPAPIERWMNRLMRRAILASMTVVGS